MRFAERHAARMASAARQLRLGPLDEALVRRAFDELAEAAFGSGSGIVRLQASRDGDDQLHLVEVGHFAQLFAHPQLYRPLFITHPVGQAQILFRVGADVVSR